MSNKIVKTSLTENNELKFVKNCKIVLNMKNFNDSMRSYVHKQSLVLSGWEVYYKLFV